jgi:ABC-type Fe3+/spermidine/putrescine transport system ATPase subunit
MLLETIAGLRPQHAGQTRLTGIDPTGQPPERRRIGMVFQDAALFPHMTVSQNVRFGPRARRTTATDADALLRKLGIWHLADRSPGSLSGGERQRVALARALAIQPGLLLLDEPLSALDQPTREDMRTVLQQLLAELTIPAAHVTHDRDEALSIGDDLAVIVGGELRQTGPAGTVAAEPADQDVARLLGWSELGHGTADNATVRIGQLLIRDLAPAGLHGAVHVFYRPEDVLIGPPAHDEPIAGSLSAHVEQIHLTRPLARISLGSDPPVTALMLHRDIHRHPMSARTPVELTFPPASLRIFQAT